MAQAQAVTIHICIGDAQLETRCAGHTVTLVACCSSIDHGRSPQASALLDLHLSRSGSREITIAIIDTPSNYIQRSWLRVQMTGMIRERMAVLLISHVALDVLSLFKAEYFPRLKATCFREAIRLEGNFSGDEEEPTQTAFFQNAPMLRSLSVTSWKMVWSLFTSQDRLLSLAIDEDSDGPDMKAFRNIAKQAPHIEDLVIVADHFDVSIDVLFGDAPAVLFASLERITLSAAILVGSGHGHLFRLPKFRRATLHVEADNGAEATIAFLQN